MKVYNVLAPWEAANRLHRSLFIKMQRALFSSRRKTVRNNLSQFLKNNDLAVSCLEKAGIDIMKRAEVLTLPELLKLSDIIEASK